LPVSLLVQIICRIIHDRTTRFHHTQNVSLHYLVKYKLSKIAKTEAQQPKTERA